MGTGELTIDWDGYAARWSKMRGGFDPRQSPPPVRMFMRLAYVCGRPLARRRSVSAAALTTIGLVACLATPAVLLVGAWWAVLSALFVLVTALAETLDGAVAVITGRITPLGIVYDATAARIGEVCWLAALWLAGAPGWLVAGVGAVSWLHEYTRTQAIMLGTRPSRMVTMADRPMRVGVSAIGLALSGLAALLSAELAVGTATMAAAVWLLLGIGGLIQLADAVHEALR